MQSGLTFGQAIEAVKNGERIAREGWNGKGMFVFQRPAAEIELDRILVFIDSMPQKVKDALGVIYNNNYYDEAKNPIKIKFGAYLCMYAADGSIVNGWLAFQTDILAEDWCILD